MTLEENSPNTTAEEKIGDKEEETSSEIRNEEIKENKEETIINTTEKEETSSEIRNEEVKENKEETTINTTKKEEEKPSQTKPMLDYENLNTTGDIEVPPLLIDQVIGHEESVETIKKAAKQRRNVLLIGNPGVGKSMLAKGMAELLPPEVLQDILVYPNAEDQNNPIIRPVPAGEGKKIVKANKSKSKIHDERKMLITLFAVVAVFTLGFYYGKVFEAIIAVLFIVFISMQFKPKNNVLAPKLLVNNGERRFAPYMDATGSHAGALLGDVRHDPYQSGGLGTPPHERVEAGMIHKANKGVLYIDEIGTMSTKTQQELLSAMQEKKYSITGQSENSSGAMVRTQSVPCDFVLVASGNIKVLEGMHIAMRSRIRGYGYEVFMKDTMDDTIENRKKLVQFVAQEVKNDGRIPQFKPDALDEIIIEAKRRAGKKDSLTLKLRDLGGLVRASGDVAIEEGAKFVTSEHVITAKKYSRTLEQQMADMSIENRKDYSVFKPDGGKIGMVNGLAIIGDRSGIVSPIAAEAAPTQNKNGGKIIATGKLGEIAKESVENVSALVKKYTNKNISDYDIHVQFIQTYDGVEGDSASVSIAAAVISAIEEIPLDQSVALTGSLNVRGDVMPIGGATGKIEAAAEAGIKTVLIPKSNLKDVMLESKYEKMVKIIPCETLSDVLENILMNGSKKDKLINHMKELGNQVSDTISDLNIKTPNTQ